MWNEKLLNEYRDRKTAGMLGGGAARIEKQHAKGKYTARERLDLLFDEGSFHELEMLTETRVHDFGMDKCLTFPFVIFTLDKLDVRSYSIG